MTDKPYIKIACKKKKKSAPQGTMYFYPKCDWMLSWVIKIYGMQTLYRNTLY